MQVLLVVCHIPPAFSQSARLVYFAKSALPDGLADGDEDEPLGDEPLGGEPLGEPDGLGVLIVPPEPVVPDGLVEPEPDPLLPGLVWAAANAGASATSPTKNANINFCM